MVHYWTRQFVDNALRLARRQSYRIVPSTKSGLVRSDTVLALLNRSRVGMDAMTHLPDILTADEAAAKFGVPAPKLLRWSRRTANVVPHFRINRRTLRFASAQLGQWLTENSR